MSWIFQVGGSLSLYDTFDIRVATSKGPYRFGASLGVRLLGSCKLVPSSHILVPTSNGMNLGLSVTQEPCTFLWASWAVLLASEIFDSHCSSVGTLVFLVG